MPENLKEMFTNLKIIKNLKKNVFEFEKYSVEIIFMISKMYMNVRVLTKGSRTRIIFVNSKNVYEYEQILTH